ENLRVALIWNANYEYVANAAREGLKAVGITPVFEEGYPLDRKDFTALVANLQSNKIDVLIPCQGSVDGVPFRKKMVEMGYEPPMLFAMGLIYDQPDFGAQGAEVVDGCLVLSYTHPFIKRDNAPGLEEFAEGYKAKHGWYPLTHATQTYSATLFMIDMIEKAGAYDADKIREAIEGADIPKGKYPNYWGVKFDEHHRNVGAGDPLAVGQWQKGALVTVGTDEIKVGEPVIPWDPSKL
ncbi:MAG: ABC transporter substrate-binding protein, partial [Synergistaceae bacterium]|nr:ABC transporter substrate-binding protein [Synergistaceae bacterium]